MVSSSVGVDSLVEEVVARASIASCSTCSQSFLVHVAVGGGVGGLGSNSRRGLGLVGGVVPVCLTLPWAHTIVLFLGGSSGGGVGWLDVDGWGSGDSDTLVLNCSGK